MRVVVTIECDNAAFFDQETEESAAGYELARIFKWLAGECENSDPMGPGDTIYIRDSNGNRVGQLVVENS